MMYVMLILVGLHGTPATITGFDSLDACNTQKPVVRDGFQQLGQTNIGATCVELKK